MSSTPNITDDLTSDAIPVLPRAATYNPPTTAPMPIIAVMNPKPVDPACRP